jgi:hypothetical protein
MRPLPLARPQVYHFPDMMLQRPSEITKHIFLNRPHRKNTTIT